MPPHAGVHTRLAPSKIHGVGVFAIERIAKGTPLFSPEEEIVWVDEQLVKGLPKQFRKLYEDFAIIRGGKYGCPRNFNLLTMAWYLNDSDDPNVAVDNEYNMRTVRDIEEGEELTIDSSAFSEQPYRQTLKHKK